MPTKLPRTRVPYAHKPGCPSPTTCMCYPVNVVEEPTTDPVTLAARKVAAAARTGDTAAVLAAHKEFEAAVAEDKATGLMASLSRLLKT